MDVAALKRLGLPVVARQLIVCHLFYEVRWRLGLQSRRDFPCRTHASPRVHYTTQVCLTSQRDAQGLSVFIKRSLPTRPPSWTFEGHLRYAPTPRGYRESR